MRTSGQNRLFGILIPLFFLSVSLTAQMPTYGGKPKPEQAVIDILHYTIALRVSIPDQSISGYAIIRSRLLQSSNVLLFDLMDSLRVSRVLVNDRPVPFTHQNHELRIQADRPWSAGLVTTRVEYAGRPLIAKRPPWDDGFTFTKDSTGHPWVAVTAEGTGGKLYYPCKDHPSDEPDEGADLLITVPRGLVVAGPGLLRSVSQKGGYSTFHWQTQYPINNYCLVFNVGDYTVVNRTYTTIAGHTVPMQFYVLREHAAQAPHLLEMMEKAARVKEKYFGEYPWAKEKIGLVETPHLGMEHQTMIAYGNKFNYTKIGGQDYDWLLNHEFGHEWWGNKVTAGDWADYWIHEGIGTYGDALYTRDMEGETAYENLFRKYLFQITNEKPIVQGKDIAEEDAYNNDIYVKGAFFMHSLRYVLGDSVFFPALLHLATDSAHTYIHTVNTDDVEQLFSRASGQDLALFFHLFLRTTDKLVVHVQHTGINQYVVRTENYPAALPLDILADGRIVRKMINGKGIGVVSESQPVIDPRDFYFKKVIYE